MRIHYLSFGISKTGGYRHENLLYEAAVKHYSNSGIVESKSIRRNSYFESILSYFDLLIWSFLNSNADINIVGARLGLSAILRNYFNKNQVWIVIHNYDEDDGKSALLKYYYKVLFNTIRKKKDLRFKVIAVAPYWVQYFKDTKQLPNVYYFPNLFDNSYYEQFNTSHKNAWVHLGQFSNKNDLAIFELAAQLSEKGYYCYFSTLNPSEAKPSNGRYEILYFNGFKDYLEHLSRSCCNLALSRINEGWSRVSHESILVGTPVIGYNKGGLGNLLKESNSIIVKDIEEAYTCISESLWVLPDSSFCEKYDIANAQKFLVPICQN